ncbi:MAG: DUF2254 domain-containing protein [Candidatus Eremiobacteraeota bacterium]|nr:DUF2254 domain-containing protein [Candidatus Eremiobacteraeota bacterium]MBC5801543.1 DUF2254 domain-containing protein [Candidatus Eremiobacteraeota bacterium]
MLRLGDAVVSSYLFIPLLMAAAAIALGVVLVQFDRVLSPHALQHIAWVYSGDADGARSVLSTVASSIITVASVTFSITIAALSLASQQYGPRLLRSFVRDRNNQFVLGTFVGTYLYDLMVLRTIRSPTHGAFVPNVAVTCGVAFAIATIIVLVYFLHHVSTSIAPEHVIEAVGKELDHAIDRLYPQRIGMNGEGTAADGSLVAPNFEGAARQVPAHGACYVQAVDGDRLIAVACKHDLVVKVSTRPGQYVAAAGSIVASAWPHGRASDEAVRAIARAFTTGTQRTMVQDAEFGVNQLVIVAVRALSPGINAPFTAAMCVDRLGTSLCRLAQRPAPSALRYDRRGALRVIAAPMTFADMLENALEPIRQYGSNSVPVVVTLLETIGKVARHVDRDADCTVLRKHVDLIRRGALEALTLQEDRASITASYEAAIAVLDGLNAR